MNHDPRTPVERMLVRKRAIRWLVVALLILAALYYFVFVNQYVVAHKDDPNHFMYGSIGSEPVNGLPILVFKALPVMFQDELGRPGFRRFRNALRIGAGRAAHRHVAAGGFRR